MTGLVLQGESDVATAKEIATGCLEKLERFNFLLNAYEAYVDSLAEEEALGEASDDLTERAAAWREDFDAAWKDISELGPPLGKQLSFRSEKAAQNTFRALASRPVRDASFLWDESESEETLADGDRRSDMHQAAYELRNLLAITLVEPKWFLGEVMELRRVWPSSNAAAVPDLPLADASTLLDSLAQAGIRFDLTNDGPPCDSRQLWLAFSAYEYSARSRSLGLDAASDTPPMIAEANRWYHEALDAAERGLLRELGLDDGQTLAEVMAAVENDEASEGTDTAEETAYPNQDRDHWLWERQTAGDKRALIRSKLRNEHPEWEQLETDQAVSNAVGRYCERTGKHRPSPAKQGGTGVT